MGARLPSEPRRTHIPVLVSVVRADRYDSAARLGGGGVGASNGVAAGLHSVAAEALPRGDHQPSGEAGEEICASTARDAVGRDWVR